MALSTVFVSLFIFVLVLLVFAPIMTWVERKQSALMQDRIGAIAPGMEADIIATAGNPLDDITVVRRVVFVMKGGKVYKNER